jgi:uncharacterized integral membrane protein
MKYFLTWLLKAAIFLHLCLRCSTDNQQNAEVNFFGTLWRAPMVLIVLVALWLAWR